MENLKKPRHKAICSECNGNGYKQFQIQENGKLWMSPKLLTFMLMMILLQMMLVSCTRDLQPNPYTTILKQLMKGKK